MASPLSPPSILLYGNFECCQLATSYQDAFHALGHQIIPFDVQEISDYLAVWTRQRILHRLTIRSLGLRRLGSLRWNRELVARVEQHRPALILILNGDFIMPETVRRLRALGSQVFIFYADNPFPPHTVNRPETLPCALESDCYLLWSRQLTERIQEAGVKHARYLPFGWDAKNFPYTDRVPEPEHDLVFIGGWDHEREAWLTPLAHRFNLRIWGPNYWQTRTKPNSPLRQCWQGQAALGPDATRIVANSKIVLNVLRLQNLPDGVIMRTFEVPGMGGFLLSTRTEGATQLYPENQAGAFFGDLEECSQQIEYFLARPSERHEIAFRAHEITQRGHQYVDRAREILNVYAELTGS